MAEPGDVVYRAGQPFVVMVEVDGGQWAACDADGKWVIINR